MGGLYMYMRKEPKLIVFDLDETLAPWLFYFHKSAKKSIETAAEITGIPYKKLAEEYSKVIDKEDSIEYPFAIQQLPSILAHYSNDVKRIIAECAEPVRMQFKLTAYPYLKPYQNVVKTLQKIKTDYPNTRLVILTDAPLAICAHRLNKLELLHYFDGVYGLESPKLPLIQTEVAVTQEILLKFLNKWRYGFIGKMRELPNEYRKPDVKGFKNILLDFKIESYSKEDILFIGDNVYRDIPISLELGITGLWAKYGTNIAPEHIETLKEFTPERFIHKGINLDNDTNYPKADYVLDDFSEILEVIKKTSELE